MIIVKSKNNVSLRLTKERWNHIVLRHPEMDGQKGQVLETLTEPDLKGGRPYGSDKDSREEREP